MRPKTPAKPTWRDVFFTHVRQAAAYHEALRHEVTEPLCYGSLQHETASNAIIRHLRQEAKLPVADPDFQLPWLRTK